MTAVLTRPESPGQWGSMPGWNIVADLTPPELINARRLGVIRRRIAAGLVAVAVLCGAGYAYAIVQHSSAADKADAATAQTTDLTRAGAKYAGITRIENTVDAVRAQVASVMLNDVDIAREVAAIRAALPGSMSIQNLAMSFTPAALSTAPVGLDASGHAEIGTVTMSGSGRTLDDLPAFVDRLVATRGVANVVPTTNLVNSGIAHFSLSFALTDELYSHRYDVTNTGGH